MNPAILDLYERFTHGEMSRREFLDRLARLVGGPAAAMAVLPLLRDDHGWHGFPPDRQELVISEAEWDAHGVRMGGYLARKEGGERRPGVIVIHENRGLTPHIRDVTRRFAHEGFLALGVDMLSPLGGTPADEDQARTMLGTLDAAETVARMATAVPFLAGRPECTGKVGAVGFCWGGGHANRLAAAGTTLAASVPYYGSQLPVAEVPKITAPLCLHYAGLDTRINAGIADYEAALKANGKPYEIYMYEGADHAFNNDTNEARYNKEAAELAWGRTVDFFKRHLSG
jgi:carboxymethylenebutenolidase